MSKPTHAMWVDLETAGTDEREDPIVEIACLVTDLESWEVLAQTSIVRNPYPTGGPAAVAAWPAVVREMHAANGLLAELEATPWSTGEQLDRRLQEWRRIVRRENGIEGKFVLAGSGVGHFDSRFLRAQLPLMAAACTFYTLDVGVVRRCLGFVGREDLVRPFPEGGKAHRALDDIVDHLAEWRRYASLLREIPYAW